MKYRLTLTLLVTSIIGLFALGPGPVARADKGAPLQARTQAPEVATVFGLAGQGGTWEPLDGGLLQAAAGAGAPHRLLELSWRDLQPTGSNDWSATAVAATQNRIDAILATSPNTQFYLDLGLQYTPAWAGSTNPLVDQYGNTWTASHLNGGGPNIYWSPTLRAAVHSYLQRVFTSLNFRNHLWTVRVGLFMGELLYPEVTHAGQAESFWAFDATAQAQSPVPGWRPGQPSPNGEAARFYHWYVDNLANTFNFILSGIRPYFGGYVAPVTPGKGMAPPTEASLIAANLVDLSQRHYGTGNYWYRIFPELGPDPAIMHWCSSVGDVSILNENSANWWDWSSAKAEAWMAHAAGRPIYAENPGHNAYDSGGGADPQTTMQWIFGALVDNGYLGIMWVRESDMTNPAYSSLAQYGSEISSAGGCGPGFSDVPPSSPFYVPITDLVERGAISGYADCTFRAGATITRAQAAKVIVLGLGWPMIVPPTAHFSDVPVGSPFFPYVETAYAHGIAGGYADGTFRSGTAVTRSQLAKMVVLARGWTLQTPGSPTFSDVPATSGFYAFVETAYAKGIVSGYGCGSGCLAFAPAATATRGQGSKIIDNAITTP